MKKEFSDQRTLENTSFSLLDFLNESLITFWMGIKKVALTLCRLLCQFTWSTKLISYVCDSTEHIRPDTVEGPFPL